MYTMSINIFLDISLMYEENRVMDDWMIINNFVRDTLEIYLQRGRDSTSKVVVRKSTRVVYI